MRKRKKWIAGLGLIGLTLFGLGWCTLCPNVAQVEAMTAQVYNSPRQLPNLDAFTVPGEHIGAILGALSPASRDRFPAKWQVLGELLFNLRDGTTVEVHLYWTGHDRGAFSVGAYPNQVYYRGGRDSVIEEAIRRAYEDARRAK